MFVYENKIQYSIQSNNPLAFWSETATASIMQVCRSETNADAQP